MKSITDPNAPGWQADWDLDNVLHSSDYYAAAPFGAAPLTAQMGVRVCLASYERVQALFGAEAEPFAPVVAGLRAWLATGLFPEQVPLTALTAGINQYADTSRLGGLRSPLRLLARVAGAIHLTQMTDSEQQRAPYLNTTLREVLRSLSDTAGWHDGLGEMASERVWTEAGLQLRDLLALPELAAWDQAREHYFQQLSYRRLAGACSFVPVAVGRTADNELQLLLMVECKPFEVIPAQLHA